MVCETVKIPGAGTAIVCNRRRQRRYQTCLCGEPANLLCDWKKPRPVGSKAKQKTCDRPICPSCAESVGEDKHLCAEHQLSYRAWLDAKRRADPGRLVPHHGSGP